jgi:hypothetical protein
MIHAGRGKAYQDVVNTIEERFIGPSPHFSALELVIEQELCYLGDRKSEPTFLDK